MCSINSGVRGVRGPLMLVVPSSSGGSAALPCVCSALPSSAADGASLDCAMLRCDAERGERSMRAAMPSCGVADCSAA